MTRVKRVSLTPTGEAELTSLRFEWLDAGQVELDPSGKISSNPLPEQGGVYRFTLRDADGELLGIYVGESDNLSRRISNYRNPGPTQPTNIRLNERIVSILADGGSMELHVVLNANVDEQALDMTIRRARLLVENAALVELGRRGVKVENL